MKRTLNKPTGKAHQLIYVPEPGSAQRPPDELAIEELERQWREEWEELQQETSQEDNPEYPFK